MVENEMLSVLLEQTDALRADKLPASELLEQTDALSAAGTD